MSYDFVDWKHKEIWEDYPFPNYDDVHTYCKVYFHDSGKAYYYRTRNPEIQIGDMVYVPVGRNYEKRIGKVISMEDYIGHDVPYPLERTKHIIDIADAPSAALPSTRYAPSVTIKEPIVQKTEEIPVAIPQKLSERKVSAIERVYPFGKDDSDYRKYYSGFKFKGECYTFGSARLNREGTNRLNTPTPDIEILRAWTGGGIASEGRRKENKTYYLIKYRKAYGSGKKQYFKWTTEPITDIDLDKILAYVEPSDAEAEATSDTQSIPQENTQKIPSFIRFLLQL